MGASSPLTGAASPPCSSSATTAHLLPPPSSPSSLPASPRSVAPPFHSQFDRFHPSSSFSSSSSLVPENPQSAPAPAPAPADRNLPRRRKNRTTGPPPRNRDRKLEEHREEKGKQAVPSPDEAAPKDSPAGNRRGFHDNICCKCAVGFTADCAAICCCPLAVFHLLALTFIKLPATVSWRLLVKMKKRLCSKRSSADVHEEHNTRSNFTPPWAYRDSPEGPDPSPHLVRFDSQNLGKHFEAGHLGFGGLSLKMD